MNAGDLAETAVRQTDRLLRNAEKERAFRDSRLSKVCAVSTCSVVLFMLLCYGGFLISGAVLAANYRKRGCSSWTTRGHCRKKMGVYLLT